MSGRRLAGMIIINSLLQVNFVLYKDLLIFSWKFQFFLDKFHITAEITFQIIQFRTPSFHSRSSWTLCFTWNWHSGETCSLSSVFSSCSSYCYPSALLSLSQGQCSNLFLENIKIVLKNDRERHEGIHARISLLDEGVCCKGWFSAYLQLWIWEKPSTPVSSSHSWQ